MFPKERKRATPLIHNLTIFIKKVLALYSCPFKGVATTGCLLPQRQWMLLATHLNNCPLDGAGMRAGPLPPS